MKNLNQGNEICSAQGDVWLKLVQEQSAKICHSSYVATPEAPENANNAENWQTDSWFNCKTVDFKGCAGL